MSYANAIRTRTLGCAAWSFTADETANIVRKASNQFGTRYDFADGSAGWVDKGSAAFMLYVGAPHSSKRRRVER